jgi:hypothetical protein
MIRERIGVEPAVAAMQTTPPPRRYGRRFDRPNPAVAWSDGTVVLVDEPGLTISREPGPPALVVIIDTAGNRSL